MFINLTSSKGENKDGCAKYDDYFLQCLEVQDPKISHLAFNITGRNPESLNHFFLAFLFALMELEMTGLDFTQIYAK